jgi:hypothetical protein
MAFGLRLALLARHFFLSFFLSFTAPVIPLAPVIRVGGGVCGVRVPDGPAVLVGISNTLASLALAVAAMLGLAGLGFCCPQGL